MNSGLYALAGASATATAAACAKRLLEPMTKVSKTYFSLSFACWALALVSSALEERAPGLPVDSEMVAAIGSLSAAGGSESRGGGRATPPITGREASGEKAGGSL